MSDVNKESAFNWYLEAFRNYANFKGRTQRRGFWYFVLFSFLASIIATVIDMLLVSVVGFGFVYILYYLVVFIPTLALGARRLLILMNQAGFNYSSLFRLWA